MHEDQSYEIFNDFLFIAQIWEHGTKSNWFHAAKKLLREDFIYRDSLYIIKSFKIRGEGLTETISNRR